jgi:hypothetical protein
MMISLEKEARRDFATVKAAEGAVVEAVSFHHRHFGSLAALQRLLAIFAQVADGPV